MTTQTNEALGRPQRAMESDGVSDMAIGFCLLFMAALLGIYLNKPTSNPFFPLLLFVPMFCMRFGIEFLKNRFVYPRIGYATLRRQNGKLLPFVLIAALPSVSQFAYFHTKNGEVVLMGAFFGIIYAVQFVRLGFWRHLLVAISSFVFSFVLARIMAVSTQSIAAFTLILGAIIFGAGAVPFFKLLRLPAITEEDLP